MILASKWFSCNGFYLEFKKKDDHILDGIFNIPLTKEIIKVPFDVIHLNNDELCFSVDWSRMVDHCRFYTAFYGKLNKDMFLINLKWVMYNGDLAPLINQCVSSGATTIFLEEKRMLFANEGKDKILPHPFSTSDMELPFKINEKYLKEKIKF